MSIAPNVRRPPGRFAAWACVAPRGNPAQRYYRKIVIFITVVFDLFVRRQPDSARTASQIAQSATATAIRCRAVSA